jgi:uncharacterized protein
MDITFAKPDTLHPVSRHERIDLIDVVRGFALFGVLLANLVWLTTDVVLTDDRIAQLPTAPLDRIAKQLVVFFVDGKFYTLFSFLFGLGFAIQLSRAAERGHAVVATYARRVTVLAVIGALHLVLLWYGDILLMYALLGFALLAVRHWDGRILIILALALALFARTAVEAYPRIAHGPSGPSVDAQTLAAAEKEQRLAVFDDGSYRDIVGENIRFSRNELVARGIGLFLLPQIFARFLFGLYVGRRRWAERSVDLLPMVRRTLPWTVALGVIGNGTLLALNYLKANGQVGLDSYWVIASNPIVEAGVLAMSFSYLSAIVLLFHRSPRWRERLGRLAPVGRMALTNYLTHSVLYVVLFTGVGFGLYGAVGPSLCLALTVAIFGAQIAFSRWWLARYHFGPAEWLWRTLTYGQLQPMRGTATVVTA